MVDRQSIAKSQRTRAFFYCLWAVLLGSITISQARAADDLKLRPGISLTQDIDNGFPITATNLEDCKVATTTPTLLFFGASGDLNTNRQAKRFVYLYKKIAPKALKYIVVDIDHPANEDAKSLIKTHYHGYIPAEVLLDKSGKVVWNHDGEIEFNLLKAQVDKVVE